MLLQPRKRLAHRNAAGVEHLGDVVLAQVLAFGEVAFDDRLAQGLIDDIGR
ncbi:hypothetical protein D3C71_2017840 [compost metagenome]